MQLKKAAKRAAVFESIQEGSVVTGKVARLTNFGAFIDLGGVDGLVHISQISHEHVAKASDKIRSWPRKFKQKLFL